MMADRGPVELYGGILAYNEEPRVASAVHSLLDQQLPEGAVWREICVVTSGSTDQTADVVRRLAATEPRVRLIEQAERLGKSAGIEALFRRCDGDWLVLLNGDARAEPGAVAHLLERARMPGPEPVAVMARPVPPPATGGFTDSVELLWEILHGFYLETLATRDGCVLMDELLMLSVSALPPMRAGIVNDGGFIASWVRSVGGTIRYAPEARVRIAGPAAWTGHVQQRRRILAGHRQHRGLSGRPITTLEGLALRQPVQVLRWIAKGARRSKRPARALLGLLLAEASALLLAWGDRSIDGSSYVLWPRIRVAPEVAGLGGGSRGPGAGPAPDDLLHRG